MAITIEMKDRNVGYNATSMSLLPFEVSGCGAGAARQKTEEPNKTIVTVM